MAQSYFGLSVRPHFIREPGVFLALEIDRSGGVLACVITFLLSFHFLVIASLSPLLPLVRLMVDLAQSKTFLTQFLEFFGRFFTPKSTSACSQEVIDFSIRLIDVN